MGIVKSGASAVYIDTSNHEDKTTLLTVKTILTKSPIHLSESEVESLIWELVSSITKSKAEKE